MKVQGKKSLTIILSLFGFALIACFVFPKAPAVAQSEVTEEQEAEVVPEGGQAQSESTESAEPKKEEEKEPVRTGTIAGSGRFKETKGINVDSSGSSPGDEPSVISGAVSRKSQTECVAKIVNSGKKRYSVSFKVVGVDARGSKVLDKSFSGSVSPGSTLEKTVSSCKTGLNLSVDLRSARVSE